jgi:hypothetical protein
MLLVEIQKETEEKGNQTNSEYGEIIRQIQWLSLTLD